MPDEWTSVTYSSSQGDTRPEDYHKVFHRKVLTEKVLKNHYYDTDEMEWLKSGYPFSVWSTSYDAGYSDDWSEIKTHLIDKENVRRAKVKKPPVLTKKFGNYSNNRNQGFNRNKGFKNRSFSRKAF